MFFCDAADAVNVGDTLAIDVTSVAVAVAVAVSVVLLGN